MTHSFRARLALPLAALALLTLPLTAHAQGGTASSDHASAASDLSAAQKARVEARQTQFRQDITALRTNAKLSEAQKKTKYQMLLAAMDKEMLAILTPGQRMEVLKQREINVQFGKELTALRQNTKMTDAQKQARYKTLSQNRQTALLATLNPSQRTRVEKEHQAQLARASEVNRLGQQLQASESPAQVKQIHDIGLATRAQMQAVIADKTIPDQAKVAKITELRQQAQAKITTLLTPKQREQFAHLQSLVSSPLPQ